MRRVGDGVGSHFHFRIHFCALRLHQALDFFAFLQGGLKEAFGRGQKTALDRLFHVRNIAKVRSSDVLQGNRPRISRFLGGFSITGTVEKDIQYGVATISRLLKNIV